MFRKNSPYLFIFALVLGASLAVGVSVWATSIGTNVSVSGTLTSTGNVTFNGGSNTFGDAAADINLFTGKLHASTTALFTSGITTYGGSTFGDAAVDINLFTGALHASTTALFTSGITTYGGSTFGDAGGDINLFTGALHASTTALFTSGITTYGGSTFGDAAADLNKFTGELHASSTVLLSPPVTAYNNLTVGTSTAFFVDAANARAGVGTGTPATNLSVQGNALISGNISSVSSITATGTVTIGANGTGVTSIIHGFCDFGPITTGQSIAATSTGAVGCTTQVPTGLAAGDKIWLTASSTGIGSALPGAFDYTGVASSTSASRIQALIYNISGAAYTVATSTWQYFIIK